MNLHRLFVLGTTLATICGTALCTTQGLAQDSALTLGEISSTFGQVTDTCAFEFRLFDATAGGSQVGPTIERTLRVRGGLYETELDFGADAVDGSSRYLEVSVGCPVGNAALTTLTRRAFEPATVRGRETRARTDSGGPPPSATAATLKAALGTSFTYQGELLHTGSPVTDTGDFEFSLWDAASAGTQIGSTLQVGGVTIDGGRFTVSLDFGAAAFDGDARWLEIAVRVPSGSGGYTTLSPRQLLAASPYALQTRGIFVDDPGNVGVGTTTPLARLEVVDDGTRTLRAYNNASSGGVAVQASAGADTGWATAVEAYTASPDGVGVYAFNEAESGNGYAIHGENTSPSGVAIYGHATNGDPYSTGVGVYGRADGDYGAAGVYGIATATGGTAYGVKGEDQSTGNYGALGTLDVGVRGHAASPTGLSGYFTGGAVRVDADLNLRTASEFTTIKLDPEYGAGNAGRIEVQGSGDYSVLHATGNGSGDADATLRVVNTQVSGGLAAYATSIGDQPTVKIKNSGPGETLWLDSSGGGDLLVAHDDTLGQDSLRVGADGLTHIADLEVTGAYQGTIGPNNGAPFPRPAYDSGWIALADGGEQLILTHGIGGNSEDYVVDLQFKDLNPALNMGVHNFSIGMLYATATESWGGWWKNLTSSKITIQRAADDMRCDEFRVRIWVVQ